LLERLARHTCAILDVEQAWVLVRDHADPRSMVAVAGHGVGENFTGSRFGVHECVASLVLSTGEPAAAGGEMPAPLPHPGVARCEARAAAPIRVGERLHGALVAATTVPGRRLVGPELDLLAELAELAGAAIEHAERHRWLDAAVEARVDALATAMDMRDGYTGRHSGEVVPLALGVGERLGLDAAALRELEFAARLHDIGKIAVPDAILRKPTSLDADEWSVMRCHPAWGSEMLARIPGLELVATIVRFHHERWDGRGYPDGLAGDRIPLASRVIFACDAYRAMMADRPYRRALGHERAAAELRANAGSQFDAAVVETLLDLVESATEPAGPI
jgi:hypothetical protein